MKKIIAVLLTLLLVFCVTGCAKKEKVVINRADDLAGKKIYSDYFVGCNYFFLFRFYIECFSSC